MNFEKTYKQLMEKKQDLEDKVADFLFDNPNPSDEEFHEWAEGNNINVHTAESAAYSLASLMARFLKGGLAEKENVSEGDVDPKELKMGIDVEYEHTPDKRIAKRIALDHLAELDDYYTKLAQMEGE